ncbi:hypothetical protein pb186bvf_007134 [Paramecium bursaria]
MDEYQYEDWETEELVQHQSNQQNGQKQYNNYDQLMDDVLKYIKDQSEKLYIDKNGLIDNCLNVMVHFEWSDELLNKSGFFENSLVKLLLIGQGVINQYLITKKVGECESCLEKVQLYQIGCFHYFCIDCYQQYVINKLKNNTIPQVRCLKHKCKRTLPYQIIQLLNSEAKKYFKISLCKSFLKNNMKYVCCLGEECEVIHSTKVGNQIDCANCHTSICIICKQYAHQPLNCDLAKRWEIKNNNQEEKSKSLIRLEYQTCFSCKEAVEKSSGCNHMKCRCGAHFCYICGQNWTGHENFYNCKEKSVQIAKIQTKQYLSYLNIYESHQNKIQNQVNRNKQIVKRAQEINNQVHNIKININNIKQLAESIILQFQTLKFASLYEYYFIIDYPNKKMKIFKDHCQFYEIQNKKSLDHLDTLGQLMQYIKPDKEYNELIPDLCQICQFVDNFPTLYSYAQEVRKKFLLTFNYE